MDSNGSPTWSDVQNLTPAHARYLEQEAAISPGVAQGRIRSATTVEQLPEHAQSWGSEALPAIVFSYLRADGTIVEQVKPDNPIYYKDEPRPRKYLLAEGSGSILNYVRHIPDASTVLIVEGTKQSFAVASHAPAGVAVYGIAGCRNWSEAGVPIKELKIVRGKDVVVIFDADLRDNLAVWSAGEKLGEVLKDKGAKTVKYAKINAASKVGVDDMLKAEESDDDRAFYLAQLVSRADGKMPKKPAPRREERPAEQGDEFFEGGGLLTRRLGEAILGMYPGAVTAEERIALYRPERGFFNIDKVGLIGACTGLLGDNFRTSHCSNVEMFLLGELSNAGMFLPQYVLDPLLNVPNGMLDLETSTLKPHDPVYFSTQQIAVPWDPDATCPTYERWAEMCGIGDQLDDLEETVSMMLDPSTTPSKAVFLFGPSRSGKSTFLRLMQAIVGQRNLSAVTLHQLSENRFAAANVFGKMLNCAADLSAAHVEDISIFKMMSGEDPIQADRKFGNQFAFVNRALFAFSANELPTVGEGSRAYVERIKPFEFGVTFAGREDPSIEKDMMRELPGILARWVRAWQRRKARGRALPTNPEVLQEFETRSDRIRQFVSERCEIHLTTVDGQPVTHGTTVDTNRASTKVEMLQAFNEWADENNTPRMGRNKVIDRLMQLPGVVEVRRLPSKTRALNVTLRSDDGGVWAENPAGGSSAAAGGNFEPQNCHSATETATEKALVTGSGGGAVAEVADLDPPVPHSSSQDLKMVTESGGVGGEKQGVISGVLDSGFETATSATPAPETVVSAPAQAPLIGVTTAQAGDAPQPPRRRRDATVAASLAPNTPAVTGTPFSALVADTEYGRPTCPHCRGRKELVPPSNFWTACRTCFPATFGA